MCDLDHHHHGDHFGFLVDTPQLRDVIDEARRLTASIPDVAARVEALRPAFEALLRTDGWLPDSCATPDETSKMGGGIGQYALYRAEDRSLCLFSLVVPPSGADPASNLGTRNYTCWQEANGYIRDGVQTAEFVEIAQFLRSRRATNRPAGKRANVKLASSSFADGGVIPAELAFCAPDASLNWSGMATWSMAIPARSEASA
jgi:hypothetical protein